MRTGKNELLLNDHSFVGKSPVRIKYDWFKIV